MLVVEKVAKTYGEHKAVSQISFSVQPGEIVGIIGPNGAGKTTTLKMVCGLLRPDAGSITVNNFNVQEVRAKSNIGYVPEHSPIYEDMTVREYLRFFGSLYDCDPTTVQKKGKQILHSLDFRFLDRELGNLSKGMKRKVMIARSLIYDPPVLVYDEPASGLDPQTTHFIVDYIKNLKKQKKAVLISGHNLFQMEQLCDRIIVLNKGVVQMDDTIQAIKASMLKQRIAIWYTLSNKEENVEIEQKKLHTTLHKLMEKGATILHVESSSGSLEEAFLALTK